MTIIEKWENISLSRFFLDPSADRAVIEIGSCFDGSDLATIICSGILVFKIDSALTPNGSELPVFICELTVASYESDEATSLLLDAGYSFRFEDRTVLPKQFGLVTEVVLTGGEIEARLIVIDCQLTLTPDSQPQTPLTPRG